MPCTGPSKEDAYKRGEEAFNKLALMLKKDYNIDITIPCNFGMDCMEFDIRTKKLKKNLQKLFWADAVNSF